MSWRLGALIFGGWTLIGLVFLSQSWTSAWVMGKSPLSLMWMFWLMASMWLWALMTPFIFHCSDRFPLTRPRLARHLGLHLALCLILWVVDSVMGQWISPWVDPEPMPFLVRMAKNTFLCFFSYVGLASIGHAIRFYRMYVDRRVRASELEAQLLRAQFLALQMQLRPHFLFNALNTISGLIRTGDSRGAIQMTAGLADLLRAVLRSDGSQEVPLHQELDFVERYLRVEQLRFQVLPSEVFDGGSSGLVDVHHHERTEWCTGVRGITGHA